MLYTRHGKIYMNESKSFYSYHPVKLLSLLGELYACIDIYLSGLWVVPAGLVVTRIYSIFHSLNVWVQKDQNRFLLRRRWARICFDAHQSAEQCFLRGTWSQPLIMCWHLHQKWSMFSLVFVYPPSPLVPAVGHDCEHHCTPVSCPTALKRWEPKIHRILFSFSILRMINTEQSSRINQGSNPLT